MNAKQLTRELRRIARQEVPNGQPDLWPAIRSRVGTRRPGMGPAQGNVYRSEHPGDLSSVYVWHADERPSRFGNATRLLAAGAALAVVAVLAVILGNHGGTGDKQPIGAGGVTATDAAIFSTDPALRHAYASGWGLELDQRQSAADVDLTLKWIGSDQQTIFLVFDVMPHAGWPSGKPRGFNISATLADGTSLKQKSLACSSIEPNGSYACQTQFARPTALNGQSSSELDISIPMIFAAAAIDRRTPFSVPAGVNPDIVNPPPGLLAPEYVGFTYSALLPLYPDMAQSATGLTCPVTTPPATPFVPPAPYSATPYPDNPDIKEFWYGTPALWTFLPDDGTIAGLNVSGGYSFRMIWLSLGYNWQDQSQQPVSISGVRLDGPSAPLKASVNGASSADFHSNMLAGIDVPAAGCWKITGSHDGTTLSVVVRIQSTSNGTPTSATPTSQPLAWNSTGWLAVPIEPLNGSHTSGTIDAQILPSGDLQLSGTPNSPQSTLIWHVFAGACPIPSGSDESQSVTLAGQDLVPSFYSQATGSIIPVEGRNPRGEDPPADGARRLRAPMLDRLRAVVRRFPRFHQISRSLFRPTRRSRPPVR